MGNLAILALRVVLVVVAAGALFFQVLTVIMLFVDANRGDLDDVQVPLVVIAVLGLAAIQVITVCVWRLLTMVRRGTVFSHAAFRYVDIVIGAFAAGSLLMFAVAVSIVTLVPESEDTPPGGILMIGIVGVMVAGVALIVYVLRMLLAQAVARDAEARHLRSELEDVI